MAHYAQLTKVQANQFVAPSSRYSASKVIHYTDQKILTFETYKRKPKSTIIDQTQYMTITPYYEYRPDLVSFEVYSTVDFWWRLLEANGMKDILEFRAGRNIRLPSALLA